jgi:stage II sporulation protein GA (sporulation sigma-E factor processing peptidase)
MMKRNGGELNLDGALVFYVDEQLLLALANGILDYLLLWATAAVTRISSSRWRLALGAVFGTIYYIFYVLALYGLIPYYGLLGMWATLLGISLTMLLITFAPLPWGKFRMVVSHFYLISFISAGTGLAGMHLLSGPKEPNQLLGLSISIISLLLTAQLGWSVLQRRSWRQGLQLETDITLDGKTMRITTLLDTGNQLREPLLGAPVIIVDHHALYRLLPREVIELAEQVDAGDIGPVYDAMQSLSCKNRLCIIPYHSLGSTKGFMVGFRPDVVTLWLDNQAYSITHCVIALATHKLDPGRVYRGLIGTHLLEEAMSVHPMSRPDTADQRQREESAHAITHG